MERQELSDLIRGESRMAGMYKAAVYSPFVATIAGCTEKDSDYLAMGGMVAVGALVVGGLYAAIRSSRQRRGSSRSFSRGGTGYSGGRTDFSSSSNTIYDDSPGFWSTIFSGSDSGSDGGCHSDYSGGGDWGGDCGGDGGCGGGDGGCGGGD